METELLGEETASNICFRLEHHHGVKGTETAVPVNYFKPWGADHFSIYTFPAREKRKLLYSFG